MAIQNGLGRHVYYLTISQVEQTAKYVLIAEPLVGLSLCAARISVTFFLRRVLVIDKKWKTALVYFMGFMGIQVIATFVAAFFQCVPLEAAWNVGEEGKCWPKNVLNDISFYSGGISIITCFSSEQDAEHAT